MSWYGLATLEALVVFSGLARWEKSKLVRLDQDDLRCWADAYDGHFLVVRHLEELIGEERRVRSVLAELDRRFAETMAIRQALPEPVDLPLDTPVDRLGEGDLDALKAWFDRERAQRLVSLTWQPDVLRAAIGVFKLPRVELEVLGGNYFVRFPGATTTPSVRELLDALESAVKGLRRVPGESDLAHADYLGARGFREQAEPLYRAASLGRDLRGQTAAAGYYIAEGRVAEAESVLASIVERCRAQRLANVEEVSTAKREGSLVSAFTTERDAQRALVVWYQRAGDDKKIAGGPCPMAPPLPGVRRREGSVRSAMR